MLPKVFHFEKSRISFCKPGFTKSYQISQSMLPKAFHFQKVVSVFVNLGLQNRIRFRKARCLKYFNGV